jgi:hypothetical protein
VSTRTPIRLAALAPVFCVATLIAGCGSTGTGSPAASSGSGANGSGSPAAGRSATPVGANTSPPAPAGASASTAKCTDLTPAAASASLGKAVTVTLDTGGASLPGLTICDVTVADEGYPIQLDVDTTDASTLYASDQQSFGGSNLSGVGDKAFTDSVGVEVLSGSVDIQVIGPAGPVLGGDFTTATAVAKAMVAAL